LAPANTTINAKAMIVLRSAVDAAAGRGGHAARGRRARRVGAP
jgi:hypothetical protein